MQYLYVRLLLDTGDQDRLDELNELLQPALPVERKAVTPEAAAVAGGDLTYV